MGAKEWREEWGANFSGSSPCLTSCFELFSGKFSVGALGDLTCHNGSRWMRSLSLGVLCSLSRSLSLCLQLVSFRHDPVTMHLSEVVPALFVCLYSICNLVQMPALILSLEWTDFALSCFVFVWGCMAILFPISWGAFGYAFGPCLSFCFQLEWINLMSDTSVAFVFTTGFGSNAIFTDFVWSLTCFNGFTFDHD